MVTIEATLRESTGKGHCRKLRKKGMIPANLMADGKSTSLALDPKWLSRAWRTGREFELSFEGRTTRVRIHELQIDPVRREAKHVDLIPIK